jgi:hypothetical protein
MLWRICNPPEITLDYTLALPKHTPQEIRDDVAGSARKSSLSIS